MNPEATFNICSYVSPGKEATVKVKALSNSLVNIFVTASTLEEASRIAEQAREEAVKAMKDYKPVETARKINNRYETPKEAAKRKLCEYEATTAGSRFKRSLELSKDLFIKKSKGGLTMDQSNYLYNQAVSISIYEAIYNSYEYGFRQGYNTAKKEGGKK